VLIGYYFWSETLEENESFFIGEDTKPVAVLGQRGQFMRHAVETRRDEGGAALPAHC
jgi:hypothetical protein